MQRVLNAVARLTDTATAAIMTIVFAVMIAAVFYRYVLNDSLLWSEEFMVWGLVWIVMLGSVSVMARWRHVYVPIAVLSLPLRWRVPLVILSKIFTAIFLLLVVKYGADVFMAKFHRTSPTLGLSSRWEKLAIPVGSALMSIVAIIQIIEDTRAWVTGRVDQFASYGDADLDI